MLKKSNNLVTVLLTGNKQIYKVAQSLLDESGIEYFINGNGNKESDPLISENAQIEIQVKHDKAVKARTLLADLQELDFDEMTR